MSARASIFGNIVFALVCVGSLAMGSFDAKSAEPGSFQIRQVVDNKDSAGAEELPVAHARPGGESSLRVMKEAVLNGADVARATTQKDPITGGNEVLVTLTEKGKERFAKVTEDSIGKRLAIVVDRKIVSAPVIRTKIPGGSLAIAGNMTAKEAEELAEKFNGKGESKK